MNIMYQLELNRVVGYWFILEIEPPSQVIWDVFLVQFWCNWGGKDGFCALGGQIVVNSIERMDGIYPYGKDLQCCRPIRSQTLESEPSTFI
ncbi:MAG: hypothetical protein WBB64_02390 [Anaerolineales bacterium]